MKTPKFFLKILILLALLIGTFVIKSYAASETLISIDITGDTHWKHERSPYVVDGYITVKKDAILKIGEGVIIKFKQYSTLTIDGVLQAEGTVSNPIIFTSHKTDPSPYDYWGIFINGTSTKFISHINIDNSAQGLKIRDSNLNISNINISNSGYGIDMQRSSVQATNINFQDMFGDSIGAYSGSRIDVDNLKIENIHNGNAIGLYGSSSLNLSNSVIKNAKRGSSLVVYSSKADISSSSFEGGDDVSGIEAYDEKRGKGLSVINIEDSVFNRFYSAISNHSGLINIKNSTLNNNKYGIENLFGTTSEDVVIDISKSKIENNSNAGIDNYGGSKIKAVNNWWGSESGPQNYLNASGRGDIIVNNPHQVEFTPWSVKPQAKELCCSNILFIPGFQGSRLYTSGAVFENQLWEPNRNADIEKMYLDENGKSINTIYTRDIVDSGLGYSVYKKFGEFMDAMVSEKIMTKWLSLPYDWRYGLDTIIKDKIRLENGELYSMVDEIEKAASTSKNGKVTLIAHSNGGLVAKRLISELVKGGKEHLIDNLIMIASPQLGTPKAIASLLHGDEGSILGGLIMSKKNNREFGKNMPGAYNFLPSEEYFKINTKPVIEFDSKISSINNFIDVYGSLINTHADLVKFLKGGDGRVAPSMNDLIWPSILNSNLLDESYFSHKNLDVWIPPKSINVFQISGWGLSTVETVKYTAKENCLVFSIFCNKKYLLDHEPIYSIDGDKTVVSLSTNIIPAEENMYFDLHSFNKENKKKINHADILEALPIQNKIKAIIKDNNNSIDYFTKTKPQTKSFLQISVHSPVSIEVYDQNGNYTGLNNSSGNSDLISIREEISNSNYNEFGEGKYIILEATGKYRIIIKGQEAGIFTLKIKELKGDIEMWSKEIADIPVTEFFTAKINIENSIPDNHLLIDINKDGETDMYLELDKRSNPEIF
jgi:hypothetical protein